MVVWCAQLVGDHENDYFVGVFYSQEGAEQACKRVVSDPPKWRNTLTSDDFEIWAQEVM